MPIAALITNYYFQIITFIALVSIGSFFLFRKIQYKEILIILIILSLIPKLFYLYGSNYELLPNDISGHTDYIKIVAQKLKLPNPSECWECYQPPLFYISGAFIYRTIESMGVVSDTEIFRIMQFYCLLLYYGFLLISILIINKTLDINKNSLLAISLLLFWPSSTLQSLRIANDVPAYLFFSLAFFYLIKWWQTNGTRSLIYSCIFSAVGLLVKSNLAIMVFVFMICFLYKLFFTKRVISQKIIEFIIIFIILSVAILLNQRNTILGIKQDDPFVGNYKGIPSQVYGVGNALSNYIQFDFNSYTKYATIIPAEDASGRLYFLNYLFKTALFTELKTTNFLQLTFAIEISYLFLGLVILSGIGLIGLCQKDFGPKIPLITMAASLFLSLAIFRYRYPLASSNDFRYIYPLLIPFVIFVAWSYRYLQKNGILKNIYHFIILLFILLSSIYYFLPSIKI